MRNVWPSLLHVLSSLSLSSETLIMRMLVVLLMVFHRSLRLCSLSLLKKMFSVSQTRQSLLIYLHVCQFFSASSGLVLNPSGEFFISVIVFFNSKFSISFKYTYLMHEINTYILYLMSHLPHTLIFSCDFLFFFF